MLEIEKDGKNENPLAQLLLHKLGQMPDCKFSGDHADMLVPRANIAESGKAVLWLNNLITEFEEQDENKESDLLGSLKGLYTVLRDCALMAKHYLGFRESRMPPKYRNCDLIYRFTLDSKDRKQINMEIGSAVRKTDTMTPERSFLDDDD